VTSYTTMDIPTIVGQDLSLAETPVAALAENLLLLRHGEYRGELRRLFTVLTMRYSAYERAIREYTITAERGIEMQAPPPATGLLTGLLRPLATDLGPQPGSPTW
jgi:circadian clock protein KaiC